MDGGDDIGPGVDLEYGITVEQLPRESTELPLRTLLRYSDGREDAWIELPTDANPDPEQPAPTITVGSRRSPAPSAKNRWWLTTTRSASVGTRPGSRTRARP